MNFKNFFRQYWRENRKWFVVLFCLIITLFCASVIKPVNIKIVKDKIEPPKETEGEGELINISPDEIVRINTDKKEVIFTFDAGSGNVSINKIIEILGKHHVKGTFFMTGKFIEANPNDVKAITNSGHEIFNHTYSHPHLTEISSDEVVNELKKMDDALYTLTGRHSKPFFRPPFGDRDERVIDTAFKAGYEPIYWTVDARDWLEPEVTEAEVKNTIISNLTPGTIYMMHVGDTITGSILDDVFTDIESRGYKISSLTQALSNSIIKKP